MWTLSSIHILFKRFLGNSAVLLRSHDLHDCIAILWKCSYHWTGFIMSTRPATKSPHRDASDSSRPCQRIHYVHTACIHFPPNPCTRVGEAPLKTKPPQTQNQRTCADAFIPNDTCICISFPIFILLVCF